MSQILVSPFELARIVAKNHDGSGFSDGSLVQPTVLCLLNVCTKYVNHSFKQIGDNEAVVASVPFFGQFVLLASGPRMYQFWPSNNLQSETNIPCGEQQDLSNSQCLKKDLRISKIAEIVQVDKDCIQNLLTCVVRQIGQCVRSGRSVAFDLKLPNEVFMLISSSGYEFKNKYGIAEQVNDMLSGRTETSSRQPRSNQQSPLGASTGKRAKNDLPFKKRTLSIAVKGDKNYLGKGALKSLNGEEYDLPQGDRQSINSGLFSTKNSRASRFPSIQPEDRVAKNALAASDILSHRSRLTGSSRLNSSRKYGGTPKMSRPNEDYFVSQLGNNVQKKEDEQLIQKDVLSKIIAKKRQQELEKKNRIKAEKDEVGRVLAEKNQMEQEEHIKKKNAQMTLKEKLMQQKLERINKDANEKDEIKKQIPLSNPFSKNHGKKNLYNRFDVTVSSGFRKEDNLTEFQGIGTDDFQIAQFNILKKDGADNECKNLADERVGQGLEKSRQQMILERKEFEKQQAIFTQKEMLRALQKKEKVKANKEYWIKQSQDNEQVRKFKEQQELDAPYKAKFLEKIFKNNDMGKKPIEDVKSPIRQVFGAEPEDIAQMVENYKPKSRMQVDRKGVKEFQLKQMHDRDEKQRRAKLIDRTIGQHMNDEAATLQAEHDAFLRAKREKTKDICTQQWSEAMKVKHNMEIVDRIFV